MIRNLIRLQLRYSWYIIAFFVLLIGVSATYLPDFRLNPSLSALVSDDSEFNTNDRILSNSYPINNAFSVILELDDQSILASRITDLHDPSVKSFAVTLRKVMAESQYVERIGELEVNKEGTYAKVDVLVSVPRNTLGFQDVIDDLNAYLGEAGSLPGVKTSLSGFSLLLTRINLFLVTDNLKAILFTSFALFFVLFWYFRSLRFTLITMSIPAISILFLAALMAAFEIPLTITLAAVGVLMLGLGVDYAIHVALGYESNCKGSKNKEEAIIDSGDHLGKAILASYITTLAGFTALAFGVSPSSQGQGLVLSIGITLIFLVTILLLPSLLFRFGGRACPVENDVIRSIKMNLLRLAKIQTRWPKIVLFLIGIVTVVMVIGASKVEFSTSNNNWVPDDDPVAVSFRTQSLAFGNDFSALTVVIQSTRDDLRNVETVRDIQNIRKLLLGIEEVEEVSSPFDELPLEKAGIIQETRSGVLRSQFNKDFTLTTMTVRVTDFTDGETGSSGLREEIFEVFRENPIYFAETSFFGDTIRFNELGESLQSDTQKTTLIAFILVFVLSSIAYASFAIGFIALIPVIIAIVWTVGFMGYLGVPFTSLSSGLIALVLGVGVDFSIHLVNSTKQALAKGKNLSGALEAAIMKTGTPIFLTSATTFIGFLSLLLATLLGVQRLGMSLALSILSVFLVSMIMVPALLALMVRRRPKNISRSGPSQSVTD